MELSTEKETKEQRVFYQKKEVPLGIYHLHIRNPLRIAPLLPLPFGSNPL